MNRYRICALDKGVDADAFRCGQSAPDDYIGLYASQDVRRNVARVFVATPASEPRRLAGFFTLSAGSIKCSELPSSLAKKLPRYPVPVALTGRLGVVLNFQGQGQGSILLADACQPTPAPHWPWPALWWMPKMPMLRVFTSALVSCHCLEAWDVYCCQQLRFACDGCNQWIGCWL